jgi:hypothetical protein
MAFAEKMAEIRLAGLKAVQRKLQAPYDSLDAKQKKLFTLAGASAAYSTEARNKGTATGRRNELV